MCPIEAEDPAEAWIAVEENLAIAQAMRYAEELRELHSAESRRRIELSRALVRLEGSYATTVRALAMALELRDDVTGGHAERVTGLALGLAARVAPEVCEDQQLEYGFLLHDIGKIGVPDAVLLKPGPLTPAERAVIEMHPLHGDRIIGQIPYLSGLARDIVVSHHEHWDGSGYPHGLAGTAIPLGARIFALADAFDAMSNDRPYRSALPKAQVIAEIDRNAGTQFDPDFAAAFVSLLTERGIAA